MPQVSKSSAAAQNNCALSLVIAVTGHRDLVADEVPLIRQQVDNLLLELTKRYPDHRLSLMSSLAEGADRIAAEAALNCNVDLTILLPMARDLYVDDFTTAESRSDFETLCCRANEILELPLVSGSSTESISAPGLKRNLQYAQLGVFLCAHCHILLAIWDGKPGTELGGTGQVVKFHHDDVMPGYTRSKWATQQMLVDDESDLVYHIVCSRDRPDGQPQQDFSPLDWNWFTKDSRLPRSHQMPKQHMTIFARSGEFSRDGMRFSDRIEAEKYSLVQDHDFEFIPPGAKEINRLFCIADWLAIYFQKKTLLTLRITHMLAFLMGFVFILYTDYETWSYYMFAFLVFFAIAAGFQLAAKRGAWHRKYLDYRALAEGLRVQFFWAVSGVTSENESKFSHDNFLQAQDAELGWIRNVMRVAGTQCDAAPSYNSNGIAFAIREWIGDFDSGQLGYYRSKFRERVRKSRFTDKLGMLSLLTSVIAVTLFVVAGSIIPVYFRSPLTVVMGTMLLLFGIRHGYAHSTAEKELIKQYEFMLRIFHDAERRLQDSDDVDERRQVLLALGGAALDEHAQWILMHRDRSIDHGEIWRMGS